MRLALCQLPITEEPPVNLDRARSAIADAARGGADIAIFPEATMARFGADLGTVAEPLDGPFVSGLADAAREAGVAVIAGVFEPAGDGRVSNTAVAIDREGTRAAAYRKLHLFDALGYVESDRVAAGDRPVTCEIAGLRCGLITCYDLRFPELGRALVDAGARLLVVIAAWGAGPFKEEHWTTLVRARAIENTVWLAAVDQVPDPGCRPTRAPTGTGRSMLVDPFGVVRADLGADPAVRIVEVDAGEVDRVRAALPSLANRRRDVFG